MSSSEVKFKVQLDAGGAYFAKLKEAKSLLSTLDKKRERLNKSELRNQSLGITGVRGRASFQRKQLLDQAKAFGLSKKQAGLTPKLYPKKKSSLESLFGSAKTGAANFGKLATSAAVAGAATAGVAAALVIVGAAAVKVGELSKDFATAAIKGAEFGRVSKVALTYLAGGDAAKANGQLKQISKIAGELSAPIEEVKTSFIGFLGVSEKLKGKFKPEYVEALTKLDLDTKAIPGTQGLAQELANAAVAGKKANVSISTFEKLAKARGISKLELAKHFKIPESSLKNSKKLAAELKAINGLKFTKMALAVGERPLGNAAQKSKTVFEQISNDVSNTFTEAFKDVDLQGIKRELRPFLKQLPGAMKIAGEYTKSGVKRLKDFIGVINRSKTTMSGWYSTVKFVGTMVIGPLLGAIKVFNTTVSAAWSLGNALKTLPSASSMVTGAMSSIVSIVSSVAGSMYSAGANIVQGLINGIRSSISSLTSTVSSIASTVSSTFSSYLGIKSPSRVFMSYGSNITEGAKIGIEKGTPSLGRAVSNMINVPRTAGSPNVKAFGTSVAGNASGGVTLNIEKVEVHGNLEELESQLSEVFRRALTGLGSANG